MRIPSPPNTHTNVLDGVPVNRNLSPNFPGLLGGGMPGRGGGCPGSGGRVGSSGGGLSGGGGLHIFRHTFTTVLNPISLYRASLSSYTPCGLNGRHTWE